VCRSCGTAHAIEHADSESGHRDRLFHLGEPYTDDGKPEYSHNENRSVRTMKWFMGPPKVSDWKGGEELEIISVADLLCAYCNSKWLTDTGEESHACPRCGGETKLVAGWMT